MQVCIQNARNRRFSGGAGIDRVTHSRAIITDLLVNVGQIIESHPFSIS